MLLSSPIDPNARTILLVEDSDDDAWLFERIFNKKRVEGKIDRVKDGEQAVEYLLSHASSPHPALPTLTLLDVKLPLQSGHDVLAWIRSQPHLAHLKVAMLTSSSLEVDRSQAQQNRADAYLVKPPTFREYEKLISQVQELL